MRIINARAKELNQIINIRREAFLYCAPRYYDSIQVQNLLDDYNEDEILWMIENKCMFVCVEDGIIVGTSAWKDEYLRHVYVKPGFMGRGIGSKLISHAEDDYRGRTNKSYTELGANTYAKAFYEKNGYHVVSREEDWNGTWGGFEYYLMHKDFVNHS